MQLKFDKRSDAFAKAKELVAADGEWEANTLQIIHDQRADRFYIEDGSPLIRPFEKIVWLTEK